MFDTLWIERMSSLANIGKKTAAVGYGEVPDSDRWTSVATLKSTLWCRRSTGVMWSERRVPVTRLAAAFWTDCNWFTSPSEIHTEEQSCSSVGARRRRPGSMFYSHLQTMTGQRAVVAGAAGSRVLCSTDRSDVSRQWQLAISYSGSFETKSLDLSLTVSEIFNDECDAMVDMTLNDL